MLPYSILALKKILRSGFLLVLEKVVNLFVLVAICYGEFHKNILWSWFFKTLLESFYFFPTQIPTFLLHYFVNTEKIFNPIKDVITIFLSTKHFKIRISYIKLKFMKFQNLIFWPLCCKPTVHKYILFCFRVKKQRLCCSGQTGHHEKLKTTRYNNGSPCLGSRIVIANILIQKL